MGLSFALLTSGWVRLAGAQSDANTPAPEPSSQAADDRGREQNATAAPSVAASPDAQQAEPPVQPAPPANPAPPASSPVPSTDLGTAKASATPNAAPPPGASPPAEDKKLNAGRGFGSVNRLQLRYAPRGESGFSQGTFIIIPYGFSFAELLDVYSDTAAKEPWKLKHFTLEAKVQRFLYPESQWGRTLSVALRYQVASSLDPMGSVGLQWNITDTPGIAATTKVVHWKTLVQAFYRTTNDYQGTDLGHVDFYHWYQFPIWDPYLSVRGANTWYILPNGKDFFSVVVDLIVGVVPEKFEIFGRFQYQNMRFLEHKEDTQLAIGVRVAH
jgi:hypothetical protein